MKKNYKKLGIVFIIALLFGILGTTSVHAEGVDQYTKLLMHMDDNNFTDECGHKVTNSKVTLDTSNKMIGNGSNKFDKNMKSYLSIGGSNDWNFKGDDFTIDFWFKLNTFSDGYAQLFSLRNDDNQVVPIQMLISDNKLQLCISFNNSSWTVNKKISDKLSVNNWYHVAIERHENNFSVYLNGFNIYNEDYTGNFIDKLYPLNIGGVTQSSLNVTTSIDGNIDEFRISKGIARWINNFTPPTVPYSSVSGITLNKTADTLQSGQVDTLIATMMPDNTTDKDVTWKSSDESIATVDQTGKVTALKEGTATITATDGSNLSASCAVTVTSQGTTPTNPTDNSGNAILTITMTNGNVKSYTVPMTKVNDFISWYDNRVSGSTGKAYYTFDKTDSSQTSFSKKTEYIIFDKISSYEVDEYTK